MTLQSSVKQAVRRFVQYSLFGFGVPSTIVALACLIEWR